MPHATTSRSTGITIRSAAPTFLVSDIAATIDWYVANLGFVKTGSHPERPPYVYASIMLGPVEIMLLNLEGYEKPDLRARRPAGLWDVYIRVDGVGAFHETVAERSCSPSPLTHRLYDDREFEVRDPNGYVLVFGGSR